MRINLAHLYAPAANGGRIDYAVFDARSASGTDRDNGVLLERLTMQARIEGLKVDQSALAFEEHGRIRFYGTRTLVDHLARTGVPRWTHSINDD